jgi:hypothetical protein
MSTFRRDLFASTYTSLLTSEVYMVADAEEYTVQHLGGSATTVVLQASNQTGNRTALAETDWSTMTTIQAVATNTLYNIEPGHRWFRAIRESIASTTGLVIAGRNDDGW